MKHELCGCCHGDDEAGSVKLSTDGEKVQIELELDDDQGFVVLHVDPSELFKAIEYLRDEIIGGK